MPRRPRRMIRRGLCGVSSCLGTFALLLAFVATAGCAGDRPPRNLILISIDTLRPDFLSCYGYEQESSPAIDRLAASGTLFEDVTSASPWTLPAQAPLEIFNAGRDVTDTAIE